MSSHTVTIQVSSLLATVTMRVTGEAEISISTRSIRGDPHEVSAHPNGNIAYPTDKNADHSHESGPAEQPGEASSRSDGSRDANDSNEANIEGGVNAKIWEDEGHHCDYCARDDIDMDETEVEEEEDEDEQHEDEDHDEEQDDFEEEQDEFEEEEDELADDVNI